MNRYLMNCNLVYLEVVAYAEVVVIAQYLVYLGVEVVT